MVANVEDMPISGNMINDTSLCIDSFFEMFIVFFLSI